MRFRFEEKKQKCIINIEKDCDTEQSQNDKIQKLKQHPTKMQLKLIFMMMDYNQKKSKE